MWHKIFSYPLSLTCFVCLKEQSRQDCSFEHPQHNVLVEKSENKIRVQEIF